MMNERDEQSPRKWFDARSGANAGRERPDDGSDGDESSEPFVPDDSDDVSNLSDSQPVPSRPGFTWGLRPRGGGTGQPRDDAEEDAGDVAERADDLAERADERADEQSDFGPVDPQQLGELHVDLPAAIPARPSSAMRYSPPPVIPSGSRDGIPDLVEPPEQHPVPVDLSLAGAPTSEPEPTPLSPARAANPPPAEPVPVATSSIPTLQEVLDSPSPRRAAREAAAREAEVREAEAREAEAAPRNSVPSNVAPNASPSKWVAPLPASRKAEPTSEPEPRKPDTSDSPEPEPSGIDAIFNPNDLTAGAASSGASASASPFAMKGAAAKPDRRAPTAPKAKAGMLQGMSNAQRITLWVVVAILAVLVIVLAIVLGQRLLGASTAAADDALESAQLSEVEQYF